MSNLNTNAIMKPRVLFVNSAIYAPGEGGYKRTLYLFDMMKKMGYNVTLVTSTFNHYAKKQRDISKFREEFPDYNDIVFIPSPSYKKNVSIKRILAGKIWKKRFIKWLKENASNYDIIYHNMPAMGIIIDSQHISKKHNHKVVIDVRDLNPEVFRVLLKNETLYRFLTYFKKRKADRAYSCADLMFAVSQEYLDRGMSVNTKAKDSKAVYIGAILDKFDNGIEEFSREIVKPKDEIWVTYAGTLGNTYDLFTLIDSAKEIQSKGYNNIRFKILGQGPLEDELKKYVTDSSVGNVDFIGFVDYGKMAAYLGKSDMTINSLKARASQSIINKVADYFAAGIPIINGSLCKEMQDLVTNYQLGINIIPEDKNSLTNAIIELFLNVDKRKQFGLNARKIALEKFDRKNSYLEIINRLNDIFDK